MDQGDCWKASSVALSFILRNFNLESLSLKFNFTDCSIISACLKLEHCSFIYHHNLGF